MRLKIEINMDNAAFEIYPEREINRILKKISLEIMAEEPMEIAWILMGIRLGTTKCVTKYHQNKKRPDTYT